MAQQITIDQTQDFLDHYEKMIKKGYNEDFLNDLSVKFFEKIESGEKIENMDHWVNNTYSGIKKNQRRKQAGRDQYMIFAADPTVQIDPDSGQIRDAMPSNRENYTVHSVRNDDGKLEKKLVRVTHGINYKEMIETIFEGIKKTADRQLFTMYYIKSHTKKRCSEVLGYSEDTCRRKLASLLTRVEKIVPDIVFNSDMILSSIDIGNARQGDVPQTYDNEITEAGEIVQIKKDSYRPQTVTPKYPAVWNKIKSVGTMPLVVSWFKLPVTNEICFNRELLSNTFTRTHPETFTDNNRFRNHVQFKDLDFMHPANNLFRRAISWEDQNMMFDMKPKKTVFESEVIEKYIPSHIVKTGTCGIQLSLFKREKWAARN